MATKKKRKTKRKRKICEKPRPKKKKGALRRIVKFHSFLAIVFLALYLALGFWMGPGALKKDIEGKVAGASTFLSLHIAGPPAKPDITTSANCQGESPYIQLQWNPTNDTDSYDIFRDDAMLVSGIVGTQYQDNNVSLSGTHSYYVVSNGPLGSAQSDTVAETAPSECYVPPPTPPTPVVSPSCQIVTIENIDLTTYNKIPKIKKRTPTLTGTTNMAHAVIRFELHSGPFIVASTTVNENGYWSWTVPKKLDYGLHTLYVTAIDPSDSSRYVTSQIRFEIVMGNTANDDEESGNKKKTYQDTSSPIAVTTGTAVATAGFVPAETTSDEEVPLNLRVEVKNEEKIAYPGSDLLVDLIVLKIKDSSSENNLVRHKIIDSRGNTVLVLEKKLKLEEGIVLREKISLPDFLPVGKYLVRVETEKDEYLISADDFFTVKEKPIFHFGGTMVITDTELLSNLGWLAILMIAIFIVLGVLLTFEYHLSRYAVLQVTEGKLKKDGFID